jgi:hypothetical protein
VKKLNQARQGDVYLRRVTGVERTGTPVLDNGRVILAYGEVTGHAHEVHADDDVRVELPASMLFEQPDGRRFLFVDRPCTLKHEEHGAIPLAPGAYEVIRQREYSPEAIRTVAD